MMMMASAMFIITIHGGRLVRRASMMPALPKVIWDSLSG